MNRQDCKIGMEVKVTQKPGISRKIKREKIGKIMGLYRNYAVIRLEAGYNEAYFYSEINEINDNEGE